MLYTIDLILIFYVAKQKTEGQNIQTGHTSLLKEKMELLTKVESLSRENQDLQKQLTAIKSRVQGDVPVVYVV